MNSLLNNYKRGEANICPHCGTYVSFENARPVKNPISIGGDPTFLRTESGGHHVSVNSCSCPACEKPIICSIITIGTDSTTRLVHPLGKVRNVPQDVPPTIAGDFLEACAVIPISKKASAALSRRCLQLLLIQQGATPEDRLTDQIQWAMTKLPPEIASNIDYIRNVGNFAAHPIKDTNTGELVEIEEGEAEWNLDVLEQLFDYYFVQPRIAREKREALNAKLEAAGKRPMRD